MNNVIFGEEFKDLFSKYKPPADRAGANGFFAGVCAAVAQSKWDIDISKISKEDLNKLPPG